MKKYLYDKKIKSQPLVNVWMVFPAIASFGMSALGYLSLFKKLDEKDDIFIEKVFLDTKKTQLMFNTVDLMGFSFSFDFDFLNIFKVMERYSMPLKAKDRDESFPLVFGGGPVLTVNPKPFENFFDFIFIGDSEESLLEVAEVMKKDLTKNEKLQEITKIEGIYVPSLNQGIVKKRNSMLPECLYTPILTEDSFFSDTFIIEVERGCPQRCRFCLASYANLPTRFVELEKIKEAIDLGLQHTNKIALLGALIAAHPQFEEICEYINEKISENPDIELSTTSLRVDSITPSIIKTLVSANQKTATIAVEAGSERLRKVINKNLSNNQIFESVKIAHENGLQGFKVYLMVGLPTETQEDIDEMIELFTGIKKKYKTFSLTASVTSFVPKAHTPFQWCDKEDIKITERKIEYLKKNLAKIGVKLRASSVKWDWVQSILSLSDNDIEEALIKIYSEGGKLGSFKKHLKKFEKSRELEEKLPWDFIEFYTPKNVLEKEYSKAFNL